MITAAKVTVEPFWPGLFAKALQGRNIGDLISNVGSAPAAGAAAAPAAGEIVLENFQTSKSHFVKIRFQSYTF